MFERVLAFSLIAIILGAVAVAVVATTRVDSKTLATAILVFTSTFPILAFALGLPRILRAKAAIDKAKAKQERAKHAPRPNVPQVVHQTLVINGQAEALLRSRNGTPRIINQRPGESMDAFQERVKQEQQQLIGADGALWSIEAAPWIQIGEHVE